VKDKIEGKAEELKGRVTGSRSAELKGKARQALGEAKRLARDLGVEPRRPPPDSGRPHEAAETPTDVETADNEPTRPTRPTDP
jgi:hypothetical protein